MMRGLLVAVAFLVPIPQDAIVSGAKDRTHPALMKAKEGEWKGAYFFIQMADPQFAKNAERAVQHLNRLKPKFAIVCGDLVHPPPGQKEREEKLAEFKRIFSKVDLK